MASPLVSDFKKIIAAIVLASSIAAVPLLKEDEGRSLIRYNDLAGFATDCDGNRRDVVPLGVKRTNEECDKITQARALEEALAIGRVLKKPVEQETFVAMIRLRYNIGGANFNTSTALRLINEGYVAEGCKAFRKFACITVGDGKGDRLPPTFLYPGADCRTPEAKRKFVVGLYNRRVREMTQCLVGAGAP